MKFMPTLGVRHFCLAAVALGLAVLSSGGCESLGASKVTSSPSDWSALHGRQMTFEGTAGNSQKGPLLRFDDGTVVGLAQISMWPINIVSRPVGVVGKVDVGQGQRNGEYVVAVERWYLVKQPLRTAPSPQSQEPYIEEPPTLRAPAQKPAGKK